MPVATSRFVRRAGSEGPDRSRSAISLGLQRLDRMVIECVAKERHQGLGTRVDSLVLAAEAEWRLTIQQGRRHDQLT